MKIGLVSDTHGSARNFQRVLDGPFADLVVRFRLSVLIHGHSHVARIKSVGKGLIVNPGAPTIPNPSSPFKKTVGILDTTKRRVTVQDVDTGKVVLEETFGT